jgi:hypothetical protein
VGFFGFSGFFPVFWLFGGPPPPPPPHTHTDPAHCAQLRHTAGPAGILSVYAVPPLAPGERVDLAVDIQVPLTNGPFESMWLLAGPSGLFFGHALWSRFVVTPRPDAMHTLVAEEAQYDQCELGEDFELVSDQGSTADTPASAAAAAAAAAEAEVNAAASVRAGVAASAVDTAPADAIVVAEEAHPQDDLQQTVGKHTPALSRSVSDAAPAVAAAALGPATVSVSDDLLEWANQAHNALPAYDAAPTLGNSAHEETAAAAAAAETEMDPQAHLAQMGFSDADLNATLLREHKGDVQRTIEVLLSFL